MVNWLGKIVQKHIQPDDTVLDLGCGIMQGTDDLKCKSLLGVDIWSTYLNNIKHLHPTVKMGMDETYRFMDNSYDVVICLDVVEHLEKELALRVLDECKRICRKKAIVYTPDHFDENPQPPEGAWGLGDNPLQTHRCVIAKVELRTRKYHVTNPISEGWFGVHDK